MYQTTKQEYPSIFVTIIFCVAWHLHSYGEIAQWILVFPVQTVQWWRSVKHLEISSLQATEGTIMETPHQLSDAIPVTLSFTLFLAAPTDIWLTVWGGWKSWYLKWSVDWWRDTRGWFNHSSPESPYRGQGRHGATGRGRGHRYAIMQIFLSVTDVVRSRTFITGYSWISQERLLCGQLADK